MKSRFIELTRPDGGSLFVVRDDVVAVTATPGEPATTTIFMISTESFRVIDSVAEILAELDTDGEEEPQP